MYRRIYVGEIVVGENREATKFTEEINGEIDKVLITHFKETNPAIRMEFRTSEDEIFLNLTGNISGKFYPRNPHIQRGKYSDFGTISTVPMGERYTTTDMVKIDIKQGNPGDVVIVELVIKE